MLLWITNVSFCHTLKCFPNVTYVNRQATCESSVHVLKCNDDTAVAEMFCTDWNCWTAGEQECEELTIMDLTSLNCGRDSSVGIATRFGLDGRGDRIPVGASFSAPFQTGPEAHPAPYKIGTGFFPGVKRLGRGVDHPPHLAPRLKKE